MNLLSPKGIMKYHIFNIINKLSVAQWKLLNIIYLMSPNNSK